MINEYEIAFRIKYKDALKMSQLDAPELTEKHHAKRACYATAEVFKEAYGGVLPMGLAVAIKELILEIKAMPDETGCAKGRPPG